MTPEHDHERQMLEHYRQHTPDEPSAAVDARILAAARAACRPAPSRWQRLLGWLRSGGVQPRWSMALAGVACVAVGLSLTWRNLDDTSARYDAPAPAAFSAPKPEPRLAAAPPAPASMEAAKRSAPAMAMQEAAADAVAEEPEASLRKLLELQRDGKVEEAKHLRDDVLRRFPKLDVDAELQRLRETP